MTDIEIDRRLALAIGYLPKHVRVADGGRYVYVTRENKYGKYEVPFRHKDANVILPLMEFYDYFPYRVLNGWECRASNSHGKAVYAWDNNLHTAAAMAIIRSVETGVTK